MGHLRFLECGKVLLSRTSKAQTIKSINKLDLVKIKYVCSSGEHINIPVPQQEEGGNLVRRQASRKFPGEPVTGIWCFHCCGQGSIPGREMRSCKPSGMAEKKKKKRKIKLSKHIQMAKIAHEVVSANIL